MGGNDGSNGGGKDRKGKAGGRRVAIAKPAVWQQVYDRLRADNPPFGIDNRWRRYGLGGVLEVWQQPRGRPIHVR